jgi:hypothetical protein
VPEGDILIHAGDFMSSGESILRVWPKIVPIWE